MLLTDEQILANVHSGDIVITPFKEEYVQPASYDVTLGDQFLQFCPPKIGHIIDPKRDNGAEYRAMLVQSQVGGDDPHVLLEPGEFVLAHTVETIGISPYFVAQLSGKSSLARLGLMIHVTAGFVDPGWHGQLTLELSNVTKCPIKLYVGMKIGHVAFIQLDYPSGRAYGDPALGSKYHGSTGAVASKYHGNF